MTTLKKARESGDFEQFIREREETPPATWTSWKQHLSVLLWEP